MNQLEGFLLKLNSLQHDRNNLAQYLFDQKDGWSFVRSIYIKQIQMNEMIGDKISDSLIELSVNLLLNHQHTAEIFIENPLDIADQLDDLVARSEHGSLLLFLTISLEVYIRYNNGQANTNSILTSSTHLSKSIRILNSLAQAIHHNNDSLLIKHIYAQFLVKLFRINFKNNQMRLKENLIISNSLIHDQFNIFNSAIHKSSPNDQLIELVVQLVVDYLFECSNLISINKQSIQTFSNLIILFSQTCKFICDNLTDKQAVCINRLNETLNQVISFKLFYEHTQHCLRSRHTHMSCKVDLANAAKSKHNDITNSSDHQCALGQFVIDLLTTLNKRLLTYQKIELVSKIGICSCIKLDCLLDCFMLNQMKDERELSVLFELESSTICEYLVQISSLSADLNESEQSKSQAVLQTTARRQSTFYSLLVDESLIDNSKNSSSNERLQKKREFNFKNNKFFQVIARFDQKSLILCKYLSSTLKKYSKYIPAASSNTPTKSATESVNSYPSSKSSNDLFQEHTNRTENSQAESFRFITFEIFYLYVKVLKCIYKRLEPSEQQSDDELDEETFAASNSDIKIKETFHLIEIICKYLHDFLLINNSFLVNQQNEQQHQQDSNLSRMKSTRTFHSLTNFNFSSELTSNFIQFLNKKSIQLNKIILALRSRLAMSLDVSVCSQLILFQEVNEKIASKVSVEQSLCQSVIEVLSFETIVDNHLILDTLLELYLKSTVFRLALNESTAFYVHLLACFDAYIQNDNDNLVYLELLLDLIFVYFYFNRKKDLNNVYLLMRSLLAKNSNLLLVYFNVMILLKAFKLNKVLLLFNDRDSHTVGCVTSSTDNNNNSNKTKENKFDYDADVEANPSDNLNETNGLDSTMNACLDMKQISLTHSNYRYDLILFPRILDLCLTYIQESNDRSDMKPTIELFFKRLLYLLETCNFNIQILLNHNFRPYFINMLPTTTFQMKDRQFVRYCFEILYYLNLNDINESFLTDLLKRTLIKTDELDLDSSLFLGELCADLLLKLTRNMSIFQCTHFLRLPNQSHQEPIDYLLQTSLAPKKFSKISLNYETTQQNQGTTNELNPPHLNRMKQESTHKISCIKIPISKPASAQLQPQQTTTSNEPIRHSYSIVFMLKFDDNLINFSRSYGLCSTNSRVGSSKLALESYAHLVSLNLDNQDSSFEIWLNPNGNLLFIRRSDQSILFPMNLMQIQANVWHFIYVKYEEEQQISQNKLNCRITHSLNATRLVSKEFEIHCSPQQMNSLSQKQTANNLQQQLNANLFLFIGHQEVKAELNYLFHYDLGQVVLSKDANYTVEHLLILTQIMDTNISQLDKINEYEWDYINGYCESKLIESLNKHFADYSDHIKSHLLAVYHPRNSHVGAVKSLNSTKRESLSYIEIISSCKSIQESSVDITLAKLGGCRQLILLLAKLVEQENKKFSEYKPKTFVSLKILEAFLNLINKRAHIQTEFKQMHGYSLLKHIYKSIAAQNKFSIKTNQTDTMPCYYACIQKDLFVLLMNSCFKMPVFCVNHYLNDSIEMCFKNLSINSRSLNNQSIISLNKTNTSDNNIYLININLLSFVLIEWDLWESFDKVSAEIKKSNCLWKNMFEILDSLLSDYNQLSLVYHTNLFVKYGLLEKLMHFVLDANEEGYVFRGDQLEPLISIFKHFNSIPSNNLNEIKQLFANFFEYLHILHPENKAYIVYATNYFYYNLTLSLPSVPFKSMQEYSKTPKELSQTPNESTSTEQNNRTIQDRFQFNESLNEKSFSRLSAGLMEIMHDMITILPDNMLNEIFNLLKYESFIMFSMDDNQTKRYEAFKLFLTLIERSSAISFIIASSLATMASAAGAMANLATNPIQQLTAQPSTAVSGIFAKGFTDQQNWNSNKENLIYAMCNQLNQFDQSDERFVEFCIKMLLNQPFSFKEMPDIAYLKSISSQIASRVTYCYILISLLYSTRKSIQLCHQTLHFLTLLLQCDIVKIDFLISKAGLIQVLFNLLRFFSDTYYQSTSSSKEIISDLKQLFCVVTRCLLRFNESQDVDNFSFYLNSIISLCYDSSNIGYEKLNLNLKSIVLNVFQSIMTDLNVITSLQEANLSQTSTTMRSSSMLFKKIIMPLIQSTQLTSSISNASNLGPNTALFDSDFRFQKFIIFLVDFIYIIYDKISDTKIDDTIYDINDELSIFAFSILLNSLSIGLETQAQSKTKFTSFFRNNLSIIRFQFRRLFLFMMHPNHKLLHTRLQLIKRLLNTSNCEIILRFVLSTTDELLSQTSNPVPIGGSSVSQIQSNLPIQMTYNLKLSFYLNALINSNNVIQLVNNDKEVLKHLNEILVNSIGFNYKTELGSILNFDLNETIASSYVLVSSSSSSQHSAQMNNLNSKLASDFLNQCDKEFDEEILKIYYRTNQMFKRFLQQFDRLTEELNEYAVNLTNQVVSMHSSFRKSYLQRIKNKRIQIFDIKQKWIHLIEKMTHEKCIWHEISGREAIGTFFFILDQTEGPNRERRRLKKVPQLNISSRFFKPEIKQNIEQSSTQTNQSSLKYLLCNYDHPMNNVSSGFSAGDYMLYYLKNSEVLKYPCACKNVMPYCEIKGELLLSEQRIYFAADEKEYANLMGIENASYSWSYDDVSEIHLRRYLLKDVGLELFLVYGHTILLAFEDIKERTSIFKFISNKIKNQVNKTESLEEVTNLWREAKISNYEYLMQLNKYSGRTFNDLMQYPAYPHILSNYITDTIDLGVKENFRDLTKPIAIQHKEREEKFLQNYKMLSEASDEAYHYASLYSNSGTVLHYLVRLPPFTKMFLDYQDNNFDVPDRTFHSMNTSFMLSSCESTTDYKELIPEFFFLHEFLTNRQGFNFGLRQNGEDIDNVTLPAWSKQNPRLFIHVMRQALESTHVSCNLNFWIDLIFGFKQSGRSAIDSINCYHPACYFGYPVEQISDTVHRRAIETMIKTWGQTPKQLFTSPHPQSQLKKSNSSQQIASAVLSFGTANNAAIKLEENSIHRLIFNIKWGNYVGSLEQIQPPVCIWKESCKKNICSLIPLATNDVIGLAQHKCLLVDRPKETGLKAVNLAVEVSYMALIEWGFYDDYIKTKIDGDKPSINLIPIRSNEHTVTYCQCIGSVYLVFGEKSGLLSLYKLKKDKKQIQMDSFYCHLYGHKQEITDIFVCLAFSTMISASQDGLLIIWDINKFSFVNSIKINNQSIYKVSISETTNDIAFITNHLNNHTNKLFFYTGNCDLINQIDNKEIAETSENILMKSLCFSNCPEGQNVNVIAVGLSNGRIRLYSTWDLSLLREISFNYDNCNVGCIISLAYTKDCKRLYASDTYARVYILEAASTKTPNQSSLSPSTASQLNNSISTTSTFLTNLVCFT